MTAKTARCDDDQPPIVLASASPTRAGILARAGIMVHQHAADIDEGALRATLRRDGATAEQASIALAEAKARCVATRCPGAFVIGADQILDCGGRWFEKAGDRDAARTTLRALRGRSHILATGVAVVRDGDTLWTDGACAELTMRRFDDGFLESYLDRAGAAVFGSVGCYQIEGPGVQLFTDIHGDFFTILGLPLLPLLGFLREHKAIAA